MYPYFAYLDLPPLPSYLEEHINFIVARNPDVSFEWVEPSKIDFKTSLGLPSADVYLAHSHEIATFVDYMEVPTVILTWLKTHIAIPFYKASIQSMHSGQHVFPHIDEKRKWAVNYLISTGGENVKTCFYVPKKEYEHLTIHDKMVTIPFDRVELVKSVVIENRRWHQLKSDQIHAVRDLDPNQQRISLSLSII